MLCHIPETLRARKDPSAVSPFPGIIGRRLAPGTIINRTSINFVLQSTLFCHVCQPVYAYFEFLYILICRRARLRCSGERAHAPLLITFFM